MWFCVWNVSEILKKKTCTSTQRDGSSSVCRVWLVPPMSVDWLGVPFHLLVTAKMPMSKASKFVCVAIFQAYMCKKKKQAKNEVKKESRSNS